MNAGVKIAGFALGLVVFAGVGAVIGDAAGPIEVDEVEHAEDHTAETDSGAHEEHDATATAPSVGGVVVAQDGYRLVPESNVVDTATTGAFAFRILGPDGAPVRDYDVLHEKELHLVVVSRDLQQYAHVHPALAADGTWSVQLPGLPPGPHRAIADFRPAGHDQLTLGVDLTVAGTHLPATPVPDRTVTTVDGYEVTLDGAPADGEVTLTVRRDGEVVTTEPYLGAAGHLVAIRDGDLGYLHVHPIDEIPNGPVRFGIEVPSDGRYALFFDFAHDGTVRTASFFVTVGDGLTPSDGDSEHTHTDGGVH